MASAEQLNFIRTIGPMIRTEAIARGYLVASPMIAQAIKESFKGKGLSLLATKYHNYHGMKCGAYWKGPSVNLKTSEEYTPGVITTNVSANWRVYDDMSAGVRGYFEFISTKRYSNLKTADTPELYLQRIKEDKYATDNDYVQGCLKIVSLYSLRDYDKGFGVPPVSVNPYPVPKGLIRRGQKGINVRWLQRELVSRGFSLVVDGDFGPKTENAVKQLQQKFGIPADGIVGPQTMKYLT